MPGRIPKPWEIPKMEAWPLREVILPFAKPGNEPPGFRRIVNYSFVSEDTGEIIGGTKERSWRDYVERVANEVDQCGRFYRDGYDVDGAIPGARIAYNCGHSSCCPRCGKRRANRQKALYGPRVRELGGDWHHVVFNLLAAFDPEDVGPLFELTAGAWRRVWRSLNYRYEKDRFGKRRRVRCGGSYIAALEIGHKGALNVHLHVLLQLGPDSQLHPLQPNKKGVDMRVVELWRKALRRELEKPSAWEMTRTGRDRRGPRTIAGALSPAWHKRDQEVKANGGAYIRPEPINADKGLGELLKDLLDYNLKGMASASDKAAFAVAVQWWALQGKRRTFSGGEIRGLVVEEEPHDAELPGLSKEVEPKEEPRKVQWWGPLKWRGVGLSRSRALRRAQRYIDFSDECLPPDEPIEPHSGPLPWAKPEQLGDP